MKATNLMALVTTMTFAVAALADVEERHEMKIVVAGAIPEESATMHWIGSGQAGLDIHNMQVGETQSIIDESGRAVLITREEDGFKFDVDGKTIVLPAFGDVGEFVGHSEYITLSDGTEATDDFDVEIVGNDQTTSSFAMPAFGTDGVTIISGEPLDATTQESIRAVLQSAGHDVDVNFIDRSSAGHRGRFQMMRQADVVTQ